MAAEKSGSTLAHLMTEQKPFAYRHLVDTAKAMVGRTDAASRQRKRSPPLREWLSTNTEVLRQTSAGVEAFIFSRFPAGTHFGGNAAYQDPTRFSAAA